MHSSHILLKSNKNGFNRFTPYFLKMAEIENEIVEVCECTKCGRMFPLTEFIGFGGRACKKCETCRASGRRTYAKRQAPGGNGRCEHGKHKGQCRGCNPDNFCEHDRLRVQCKECGNEHHITTMGWVRASKHSDQKYDRYDELISITYAFCREMIDDIGLNCFYCGCPLQYEIYQADLATIERFDNTLGHVMGNVTIACRTCNYGRVGERGFR